MIKVQITLREVDMFLNPVTGGTHMMSVSSAVCSLLHFSIARLRLKAARLMFLTWAEECNQMLLDQISVSKLLTRVDSVSVKYLVWITLSYTRALSLILFLHSYFKCYSGNKSSRKQNSDRDQAPRYWSVYEYWPWRPAAHLWKSNCVIRGDVCNVLLQSLHKQIIH